MPQPRAKVWNHDTDFVRRALIHPRKPRKKLPPLDFDAVIVRQCKWCGADLLQSPWQKISYCPGEPGLLSSCRLESRRASQRAKGKLPVVSFIKLASQPGMEFIRDSNEGVRLNREQQFLQG